MTTFLSTILVGFLLASPASGFTAGSVPRALRSRNVDCSSRLETGGRNPFENPTFVSTSRNRKSLTSLKLSLDSLSKNVVEAELFNGMAHMALDVTPFWSAATLIVRSAAVIGRVLVMATDFTPDHQMLPDELAFQLVLLGASTHALISCAAPRIRASFAPSCLTSQDRLAFRKIFRPVGITWDQYRVLNLSAMDWVTVDAGGVVTSDEDNTEHEDDCVYLLSQGTVQVHSNDKVLRNISLAEQSSGDSVAMALIGETRLGRLVDGASVRSKPKDSTSTSKSPQTTVVAGDAGATLLRINVTKVADLIKHDDELERLVNRLVFRGMQAKLNALWMEA